MGSSHRAQVWEQCLENCKGQVPFGLRKATPMQRVKAGDSQRKRQRRLGCLQGKGASSRRWPWHHPVLSLASYFTYSVCLVALALLTASWSRDRPQEPSSPAAAAQGGACGTPLHTPQCSDAAPMQLPQQTQCSWGG